MREVKDVVLISSTETTDDLYQTTTEETRRSVYGEVSSVTGTEFTNAGINGIRAELQIQIWASDYRGENTAEIDGVRYSIYRTFVNRKNRVELYLTHKAGDEHAVYD